MKNRLIIALSLVASLASPLSQARAADPKANESLYEAVLFQDAVKIKAALEKGADVNYKERDRPVLAWAAQSGSAEIVKLLLAANADPNVVDGIGHTPLLRAVDTGQIETVEVLLNAKADPNVRDHNGKTALMKAVESQKPAIVALLLSHGVDVKAVTPDGDSPALTAAQDGLPESFEIIKMLGKAKANMDASNAAYTPLFYAVNQSNKELVRVLLEAGASPDAKTQFGKTPLHEAIGNLEILQMLLAAKGNPNVTNDRGETPLHEAIANGSLETVDALLKAGADVNKKSDSQLSPLMLASNLFKNDIIELLKKSGAKE